MWYLDLSAKFEFIHYVDSLVMHLNSHVVHLLSFKAGFRPDLILIQALWYLEGQIFNEVVHGMKTLRVTDSGSI